MLIKNKKTGIEYHVTADQWQLIVNDKKHLLFKVIDKSDSVKHAINIPKEIKEFQVNTPQRIPQKVKPKKK